MSEAAPEKILEVKIYAKPAVENGGLVLWIKSSRVEEVFQRMAQGKKSRAVGKTQDEERAYLSQNPALKWLTDRQIWALAYPPSLPSDAWAWSSISRPVLANGFNLKLLTFVGLSDGLEIPLDIPMSNSMLKALVKSIKEACRELLVEYGKAAPKISGSLTELDLAAPAPR